MGLFRNRDDRFDDLDDGRTIADMSDVRPSPSFSSSVPRDRDLVPSGNRDVREELGGPEDLAAVILGALRAALSIGLVYVIVFGLVIFLLLQFWT